MGITKSTLILVDGLILLGFLRLDTRRSRFAIQIITLSVAGYWTHSQVTYPGSQFGESGATPGASRRRRLSPNGPAKHLRKAVSPTCQTRLLTPPSRRAGCRVLSHVSRSSIPRTEWSPAGQVAGHSPQFSTLQRVVSLRWCRCHLRGFCSRCGRQFRRSFPTRGTSRSKIPRR